MHTTDYSSATSFNCDSDDRVACAFAEKTDILKARFQEKELSYPPQQIFFRAMKMERAFEVWVKEDGVFHLLQNYPIVALSGTYGPKRKEGDYQIPEGIYHISAFNPKSRFHLSLRVNYPNQSDRIRSPHKNLGGDIYVHGDRVTIGCLPMSDDKIKEIYCLATLASEAGQERIPIHIFPFRMNDTKYQSKQEQAFERMSDYHQKANTSSYPEEAQVWNELKPIYQFFEQKHQLPEVKINQKGSYSITSSP